MKSFLIALLIVATCFTSYAREGKNRQGANLLPYYKRTGSVVLHFTNHMFRKGGMVTMPVSLQLETTLFQNMTGGPIFTFFQFKNTEFESRNTTRFTSSNVRYNQYMIGYKGHYHLNDLVEKIINKPLKRDIVDTYITGWVGYSFAGTNHEDAKEYVKERNRQVRGGVALGVRSMVFKWLGFSLEAGYGSYGYASFGMTFVLR